MVGDRIRMIAVWEDDMNGALIYTRPHVNTAQHKGTACIALHTGTACIALHCDGQAMGAKVIYCDHPDYPDYHVYHDLPRSA